MKIGLTGHQKMPNVAQDFASKKLDEYLATHKDIIGICSLAAGSDQLFAEKIVLSGNQLWAVIPCRKYESTFDPDNLIEYKKLLGSASKIIELDFAEPNEEAFLAAGKHVVELSDELIAIWDGDESRGLGGTADIVQYAKSLRKDVHVIWPQGITR
jgi:hypothetical protein